MKKREWKARALDAERQMRELMHCMAIIRGALEPHVASPGITFEGWSAHAARLLAEHARCGT